MLAGAAAELEHEPGRREDVAERGGDGGPVPERGLGGALHGRILPAGALLRDPLTVPRTPVTAVATLAALLAACAGATAASHPAGPPASPAGQGEAAVERRSFRVPEHGALELSVPRGWQVRDIGIDPDAPPSLRLDRPGGGALVVSTVWSPEAPGEGDPLESARLVAELARRRALENSEEQDLPIRPLERAAGEPVRGYWFTARDRTYVRPPPGTERWPNMLRGAAVVGELLVTFSWYDDAPGPGRDEVLEMMRGARHVPVPGVEQL